MRMPRTRGDAGRLYGYNGESFIAYFWFVEWTALSIGIHLSLDGPHIELHVPFGFFKVGRQSKRERQINRYLLRQDSSRGVWVRSE